MSQILTLNGAQGEGGGQIVRSSLALALVIGRSVVIEKIRAGRKQPGLLRQHLTAARAAADICGGSLRGDKLGSLALEFHPAPVRPGNYHFSVGTAGSATLVLQTILPALMLASGPSQLTLEGGTHNPWAPPLDFLTRAYLPLVNRLGPRVAVEIERYGFYPAGGGRFTVRVQPCETLSGFNLLERGPLISTSVRALVANLPMHIGQREVNTLVGLLGWAPTCASVAAVAAAGPGNVVFAELEYAHVTELFIGFGRAGVQAERVAQEVADQVRSYCLTTAPVGPFLADQWLLPLGMSAAQPPGQGEPRGGSFVTLPLTPHATTHLDILREFLNIEVTVTNLENGLCQVSLAPLRPEPPNNAL